MLNYILGVIDNECGSSSRQTIQLGLCIYFSNQFDLNLFMITIETSSKFCFLTKESMLLTSATCLIEKKFHHISKIILFLLSPIATLTALAVKLSTTKKHCKILA
jgi:hypothetical protein